MQGNVEDAIEAVETLQLANSVDEEAQEWQEIIYDLIRTIQVRFDRPHRVIAVENTRRKRILTEISVLCWGQDCILRGHY